MHKPNTTPDMKRAPLSAFQNIRSGILFGKALEDVKQIERSIALFGMIMPIIVSQAKDSLVVMDGKKRLAALKRMAFAGTLPRSLVTIPYVFVDEAHKFGRRPVLALSSQDLFRAVMSLKAKSDDVDTIADKIYLCRASVEELLQLSHLSETVRKAFFRQDISFEQAHAFSTMPCKDAQTAVFMSVGPFATVSTILTTLKTYQMDHISLKARALEPSAISKLPDTQIPQNFIWDRAA
jgi:hypothetical protein